MIALRAGRRPGRLLSRVATAGVVSITIVTGVLVTSSPASAATYPQCLKGYTARTLSISPTFRTDGVCTSFDNDDMYLADDLAAPSRRRIIRGFLTPRYARCNSGFVPRETGEGKLDIVCITPANKLIVDDDTAHAQDPTRMVVRDGHLELADDSPQYSPPSTLKGSGFVPGPVVLERRSLNGGDHLVASWTTTAVVPSGSTDAQDGRFMIDIPQRPSCGGPQHTIYYRARSTSAQYWSNDLISIWECQD